MQDYRPTNCLNNISHQSILLFQQINCINNKLHFKMAQKKVFYGPKPYLLYFEMNFYLKIGIIKNFFHLIRH